MFRNKVKKFKILRRLGRLPYFSNKVPTIRNKEVIEKPLNSVEKISISELYKFKLLSKQALKFNYNLSEVQFYNLIKKNKKKQGIYFYNVIDNLELRLGVVILRAGFTKTILQSKDLISKGHFFLNNKKIQNFNYNCKINDLIYTTNKKSIDRLVKVSTDIPRYLLFDSKTNTIKVISNITYPHSTFDIMESIEFYY